MQNMSEDPAGTVGAETATDILSAGFTFSFVDVVILSGLAIAGYWWYSSSKKNEDLYNASNISYTIQPSSLGLQQTSDNSFIKKLKTSNRSLVVFYGSQTGTGEEFAGRLAKEGIRYKLKGMVADPEECDMEELTQLKTIDNSLAVFCLATYGEGDPTDNAMELYEWLHNDDVDLTGLNYAVFGLGNKTYEHYNEVAIYVDKRMEELGGRRVYELGLGDDDANIEDDFITWKERFWPAVCDYFGIEASGEEENVRQYKLVEHRDELPERIYTGEIARLYSFKNQRPPYDAKNPYLAPIVVNRELHNGGGRSCMHLEFNIEGSNIRYEAGDHLAVYPVNRTELVEKLGKFCNTDLDVVFTLTNTDEESTKKHPFPCPCSYRVAVTHYVDITMNPRTHILKELAEYATDPNEKERLRLMGSNSPEGKELYHKWVVDENRNIVDILEDMPSCHPPLDHLCEILPRLQPRYYSISSSPRLYPKTIHVTAVLVDYVTPTGRNHKGVTTSYLAQMQPTEDNQPRVPIFVRKSQFRLPMRSQTPVIMIGPGTGLAPFRGFIQERNYEREEKKQVGETHLYFGCRKRDEDFIYGEELTNYESQGTIRLRLAFSREQKEKMYVTHLLEQDGEHLWRVIGEHHGHIYICGDAKNMAVDVRNILLKVLMEKGQMNDVEANTYLKKMEAQKRYSADVWS